MPWRKMGIRMVLISRRAPIAAAALLAAALVPAQAQQQPAQPPAAPPSAAAPAAPPAPAAGQPAPAATAQPPAVQANPVCARLETQLQTFDRSNNDAGRADQLSKFEAAAASQQGEIERQEATARRMGCEKSTFFQMFGNQPAQCTPLNNKIQSMRDNLEKIQADTERLRAAEPPQERDGQRRTIVVALAQNNCGAQYQQQAATPPPRRAGLFESLFGPKSPPQEPGAPGIEGGPGIAMPAGSYRTICVRTCDGFYYPISYASSPARFADDEKACRASCPATEVQLYSQPAAGTINEAVQVSTQQPYTALPNAFRYRASLDQACSCRRPGETWSQALKTLEDSNVEQGDIVVNDQKAKQLSAPRVDAQGRPIRQPPASAATASTKPAQQAAAPAAATPAPADAPAVREEPSKPDPNRKVRDVGPQFLPTR